MKKICIASFVGLAVSLDVSGIVTGGVNAINEVTSGHTDLGNLINDGTDIYNSATGSNIPEVGSAVDSGVSALGGDPNLNDVAQDADDLWNGEFLVQKGKKQHKKTDNKKKNNTAQEIEKGIAGLLKGLNSGSGSKSGSGAEQGQEFVFAVDVAGLINGGLQAVNDIKNGGDLGNLVNDGTQIFNAATGNNVAQYGQDVDAGVNALGGDTKMSDLISDVTNAIGSADQGEEFFSIADAINVIQDTTTAVKDAKNKNVNLGNLIKDGLKIGGDVAKAVSSGNGSNGSGNEANEGSEFVFVQTAAQIKKEKEQKQKKEEEAAEKAIENGLKGLFKGNNGSGNEANQGSEFVFVQTAAQIKKEKEQKQKEEEAAEKAIENGLKGLFKGNNGGNEANQGSEFVFAVNAGALITDGIQTITDIKNGADAGNVTSDITNIIDAATNKTLPDAGKLVDAIINAAGGNTSLTNDLNNLFGGNSHAAPVESGEFVIIRRFRGANF